MSICARAANMSGVVRQRSLHLRKQLVQNVGKKLPSDWSRVAKDSSCKEADGLKVAAINLELTYGNVSNSNST